MKKMVSFIMALMMVFTGRAFAEVSIAQVDGNFTIRNGITYGMVAEEIQQVEAENGSTVVDPPDGWRYFFPCFLEYETQLGGAACGILYFLNGDGKLSGFKYVFPSKQAYETIKKNLISKYGAGVAGYQWPHFDTKINKYSASLDILNPTIRGDRCWIVQYDDCYVLIEASEFRLKGVSTIYRIDYTVYSYEEAEKVLGQEAEKDRESKDSLDEGL